MTRDKLKSIFKKHTHKKESFEEKKIPQLSRSQPLQQLQLTNPKDRCLGYIYFTILIVFLEIEKEKKKKKKRLSDLFTVRTVDLHGRKRN